MKTFKSHKDFQDYIIKEYRINVNENSKCYSRTHMHIKQRKLCKWNRANSIKSTFTLLHEVGHCENNNSKMRRCEEEYYATQWAIDKCKEFDIEIPSNIVTRYQRYIYNELARGLRRGGSNYPTKEELTLKGVMIRIG